MTDQVGVHAALYNALLFTPGKGTAKSSPTGGTLAVVPTPKNGVALVGTEGFSTVFSLLPEISLGHGKTVYLSGEEAREWEKELRSPSDDLGPYPFDRRSSVAEWLGSLTHDHPGAAYWEAALAISEAALSAPTASFKGFALGPARLRGFTLLKPAGEWPLDFRPVVATSGQPLLVWRYGPRTFGVLVPLDRDLISETHGEGLWH